MELGLLSLHLEAFCEACGLGLVLPVFCQFEASYRWTISCSAAVASTWDAKQVERLVR